MSPRPETTTSLTRRGTATCRRCGATCAATGAASTKFSITSGGRGPRCTGQHRSTTRRSSPFSWRRARPWTSWAAQAWELRPMWCLRRSPTAAASEVGLRCILQQSSAAWRAPSCCWPPRPRWTSRTTTAGGLSRMSQPFGKQSFHWQSQQWLHFNVAYLILWLMTFQVLSTSMGMGFHWIDHFRFPSSKFPWNLRAVILRRVCRNRNILRLRVVHPCLWHPREPMWRMNQRFSDVLFATCQILQVKWNILERVSSNVSCGSQAKRPWISQESGATQKSWIWWRATSLGCTGEANAVAQWHSRWKCPWMKHGETAERHRDSVNRYQGCLRIRFSIHE